MLAAIQQFFDRHLNPTGADAAGTDQAARCAAAALLLEMMHMDEVLAPVQQAAVTRALREGFGLDAAAADELLACAEQERREATDYHQFTRLINERFTAEQRIELVERLWQVAFADAELCAHEEYLARKIAALLHVPHRAFIAARQRAQAGVGAG